MLKGALVVLLLLLFAELYILIEVGKLIDASGTILLLVATTIVGIVLVRQQGLSTFNKVRAELAGGQVPTFEMLHGPVLMLSGLLLLIPGFVTDTLGFLLLIPRLRNRVLQMLIPKSTLFSHYRYTASWSHKEDVIEGEVVKAPQDQPKIR